MRGSNRIVSGADATRVFSASHHQALAVPMSEQPEPDARRLSLAKLGQLALQALAVWGRPLLALRSLTHLLALAWQVEPPRYWLLLTRTRELGQGQAPQNELMLLVCSATRRARRRGGRR
jgi:hypothetical protein